MSAKLIVQKSQFNPIKYASEVTLVQYILFNIPVYVHIYYIKYICIASRKNKGSSIFFSLVLRKSVIYDSITNT